MHLRAFGFVMAHISAFLFSFVFWISLITAAIIVIAAITGVVSPEELETLENADDLLGPGLLGGVTLLQNLGLVAIAAALGALVPVRDGLCSLPTGRADLWARWKQGFALASPALPLLVAGALGAVTVGLFPSWIAEQLIEWLEYGGTLEMVPRLLSEGTLFGRAVLAFAIVVGAPILEELVFRGYLWTVFERGAGRWVAFIASSLLFALFHGDPVHVVSLVPTAFFLGWLRLVSGSVWPAVAAHFVNNGLGALVMLTAQPTLEESSVPLWLALLGLAFTCAVSATGWWVARRRAHP